MPIQTCTCGNGKSAVYLYSGLGQGNFGSPLKLEAPFNTVGYASAGDLNRDGRTDLVFATRGGEAVRLRTNTGGSFSAHSDLGAANFTGYPVVADFDEDGDPDVAWGQADTGTGRNVTWSRSNGAGQFDAPAELVDGASLSAEVQMIQPMDVDLDGTSMVTDVLVRINNAVGNQDGKLVATLEGTRLKLVDSSTKVGANVLTVTELNDATAAAHPTVSRLLPDPLGVDAMSRGQTSRSNSSHGVVRPVMYRITSGSWSRAKQPSRSDGPRGARRSRGVASSCVAGIGRRPP